MSSMTSSSADQQSLQDEIAELERRLRDAKSRLDQQHAPSSSTFDNGAALHALLLLSDSALPLGSFAFSSGLESYLAHHKVSPPSASQLPLFNTFLRLSLSTLASTALPYVLAAYRTPEEIETLDNDFDASTPCTVARRASIAQGRALLAVWDRSFKARYKPSQGDAKEFDSRQVAIDALTSFSAALRTSPHANAHYAPLWGLVTRILAVPLHESAYLFLFSHARTVMSAAVRASVMGPYQAQALLASAELQDRIRALVDEGWERKVEDAGQSVPVMDLWVALNSTTFNLITISAGGNDIGLTPILRNCVYQFYMAGEESCQKSIDEAQEKIANETQLFQNVTRLIEAAKPHLNTTQGLIYVTGYARFFGTGDNTCDNVTWAVWRNIEHTKQYLKLEMRQALNDMVLSVNAVLHRAAQAAGPNVRFIDYDAIIAMLCGRYCELGVQEPDPNRRNLMFYEWDTIDPGENRTSLQNSTGDGVPKGSFEGGIAEQVNKTLQEHPDWTFDKDKGFVKKNETEVGGEGLIEDTIHWLIPDSYKRIFANKPPSSDILVEYGTSITFCCAEQSYMFCKALYFGDAESCKLILTTTDPAEQKAQGKSVKGFNDEEWDVVKSRVARVGNWFKFTNPDNTHMRKVLLGTEDKELAEAVNALVKLLLRKPVDKLYAEQGFKLADLRDRCILKLEELGYQQTHPWWRSINNSIESSFGGLLLALLPNLTDVDFWVKDHQRGPPSSECISGLWGGTSPPPAVLQGWKNVDHLTVGDASLLKCGINFEALTALDLRTISIGTVLRLNGPRSLQGAENVKDLSLSVSIQFADKPLVEKAEIEFGGLLEALACHELKTLKITFINDGYNINDDLTTELNGGYFINQLHSVREALETLLITIETTDDDEELDWLVDLFQHPNCSMGNFVNLKNLVIPQVFLFASLRTDTGNPWVMPPNLEQLDMLWPGELVEDWFEEFVITISDAESKQPRTFSSKLRRITLSCRDTVGFGPAYFVGNVRPVYWDLSTTYGIEVELHDQLNGTRDNMASMYHDEHLDDDMSDSDSDEYDDDDEDANETDDDMPDLQIIEELARVVGPQVAPLSRVGLVTETAVLRFLRECSLNLGTTYHFLAYALGTSHDEIATRVDSLRLAGHVRVADERVYFTSENEELLEEDLN
ncbi:hypothetical protein E8E13_005437 [Curvularia kusanoi]|uniref:NADAR domain-containing protein n=1 Tax=Curvularia kusanoi TaxID=90978 RepID=A0A9P4T9I4_CURKU|nr:hypothetical protein E8E13_005437 [Curvularia kusanoi]